MVKAKAKGNTEKTFVEQSGSTILRWGNSCCSLVSSFKCAYSHYLGIHTFCIGHTMMSCFLLSQKCHYGVFNKTEVYFTSTTTTIMPIIRYALQKVRPLVNIVKVTLRTFIRVGSELALDKASVAYRSSYGRAVIFFNPMKNCGKFHFLFYLLCCATTYACVHMKVATKNNSDSPDPHESMGTIYNTSLLFKVNKLVMEMCKPLFGSKRAVNMDNFYTPPTVLIPLLNQNVFSQGTVRKNRRMVPASIVYTKAEAEKSGRGALKWAVNLLAGIFAFGWTIGNPVHMLSTPDGSYQMMTVSCKIGKDKRDVPAPKTVKSYNAYMQGVDFHDQLWATLALTKRHGFKKWYVKMWLAMIEIAFSNASICCFLQIRI
jgi:hypothetical protein